MQMVTHLLSKSGIKVYQHLITVIIKQQLKLIDLLKRVTGVQAINNGMQLKLVGRANECCVKRKHEWSVVPHECIELPAKRMNAR